MDTDAFSLVKKGSAVIAEEVPYSEIVPGNIILYSDEKGKARVGEVQLANAEKNVYTYTVKNDADSELTVGQSHVLGKGVYYSEFVGGVVSFVTSPAGICCLAILPCAAFVIFEAVGMFRRKGVPPTVETVKKQDEIPTYIPEGIVTKRSVVNEPITDESPAFSDERKKLMDAAGLFTASQPKKAEPPKPPQPPMPVAGKDIDRLIKETKAKHQNEELLSAGRERENAKPHTATSAARPSSAASAAARAAYSQVQSQSAASKAKPNNKPDPVSAIHDIADFSASQEHPVKRTEPPKRPSARVSPRVSRLDSLLQEDKANSRYDINDILKNIDNK